MRNFSPLVRMLIATLSIAVLATACAANPTVTVTRPPTAAELAAEAEADRAFAATPAYLARVKNRAATVDSVRFEIFTSIESTVVSLGSRTEPVIVGEQIGNTSRIAMDLGDIFGRNFSRAGFNPNVLTMTMVTEGDVTYLNSPLFAEMVASANVSMSDYPWVADIAIGWGRIDAGASSSELMADMGVSGGAGAHEMLALLDSVGGVLDGGTGEVRGVPVRIAHAQVSMAEVLEQSGQSLKSMGIEGDDADILRELFANIAVHVDSEGLVHRVEYNMDLSNIEGIDAQASAFKLRMWQRVDFFDHGSDVEIAIPLSWTDITDEFEDLLDELN